jgi:hypothetical protein
LAYADPQTVTINAVAQTLPRVSTDKTSGTFRKEDGNVELLISHSYAKRNRRAIKLTVRKVAPDVLQPATNVPYFYTATIVIDSTGVGFTNAEVKQGVDGLLAYLSASSGAKITQLLGGEN